MSSLGGNRGEYDEVKDSGTRRDFSTGANRDCGTGKGRYDLLPCYAIHRLARHFENGALKYEERNWEKGIPLHCYIDSAMRHLFRYLSGSRDEDHMAAAAWNALCFIETEQRIREGRLPAELDDIPKGVEDEFDTCKGCYAEDKTEDYCFGCAYKRQREDKDEWEFKDPFEELYKEGNAEDAAD